MKSRLQIERDAVGWPRWLTLERLASYLGIGLTSAKQVASLRQLRKTHPFPGSRIVCYDRYELDQKLEEASYQPVASRRNFKVINQEKSS